MNQHNASVDIVTGRVLDMVYFDVYSAIGATIPNDEWLGKNLYIPVGLMGKKSIKTTSNGNNNTKEEKLQGIYTVKLPDGELYQVPEDSIVRVHPQDEIGVTDILKLKEF